MKNLFIVLTISFTILYSCQTEKDIHPAVDCTTEEAVDSLKTFNQLIGTWEWIYESCPVDDYKGNDQNSIDLTIKFKADSTLIVAQDGITIETVAWKVLRDFYGGLEIKTEPHISHSSQIAGKISFCEDKVWFNSTPVDGCLNVFQQEE